MEVLQGDDQLAIKNLIINSEDNELKRNLRFLNTDGIGMHDLAMRRRTNKNFMNNLLEIQPDVPSAFVWLKNQIEFDICHTIITDWEFSGEILNYQIPN